MNSEIDKNDVNSYLQYNYKNFIDFILLCILISQVDLYYWGSSRALQDPIGAPLSPQ